MLRTEGIPAQEMVVLVNEQDIPLGVAEKLKAHKLGLLHRAFSVFVYRKQGKDIEILLQQREKDKYHCGGLWTNTCCSHPREAEDIIEAGQRRLKEEMSLDIPLSNIGSFLYKAEFENGLIEHEFDHILVGEYPSTNDVLIYYNPMEVQNTQWMTLEVLKRSLSLHPERYTPWFLPALNLVQEALCSRL